MRAGASRIWIRICVAVGAVNQTILIPTGHEAARRDIGVTSLRSHRVKARLVRVEFLRQIPAIQNLLGIATGKLP